MTRPHEEPVRRAERYATLVVYALFGFMFLFGTYLAWFQLNVLQLDAAGHIAGAQAVRDGMFHRFVDQFFLGYVQNLAYPPLEDLLLAALGFLTGGGMLTAYRIYLTLLLAAYFGSMIGLGNAFRNPRARLVALCGMFLLVNLYKPGLSMLQGLSLLDVFITGLTAEVLGAVFLLQVLRLLIRNQDTPWLTIWTALAVLSHLVTGPVTALTVVVFAVARRRWVQLRHVGYAALASAWFWLPMLAHRDLIYTAKITRSAPGFLFLLTVYLAVLLWRRPRWRPLPWVGLLVLLPTELNQLLMSTLGWDLLPAFHYYRFHVFGLLFLFLGAAALVETPTRLRGVRPLMIATLVACAIVPLQKLDIAYYLPESPRFHQARLPEPDLPADPESGRVVTLTAGRPVDFHVGSAAVFRGSRARFVKGLYWETSKSNTVLSSYLATLLDSRSIVLDYWYRDDLSCRDLQNLWDNFIDDFDVGWLLAESGLDVRYLTETKRQCYERMLRFGSPHHVFERRSRESVDDRPYDLHAVLRRDGSVRAGPIRAVEPAELVELAADGEPFHVQVMRRAVEASQQGVIDRSVYLFERDYRSLARSLREFRPSGSAGPVAMRRSGSGSYRIELPGDRPTLFHVALNPFPGFRLTDARGKRMPLVPALGGMVGIGRGSLRLEYVPPAIHAVAWWISLAGCVLLALEVGRVWRRSVRFRRARPAGPASVPTPARLF